MQVHTNHYTFVLERNAYETETVYRAVVQRVRKLLDANPSQIHTLPTLVERVRQEVLRDELERNKK